LDPAEKVTAHLYQVSVSHEARSRWWAIMAIDTSVAIVLSLASLATFLLLLFRIPRHLLTKAAKKQLKDS
jgi:hypothetical protein